MKTLIVPHVISICNSVPADTIEVVINSDTGDRAQIAYNFSNSTRQSTGQQMSQALASLGSGGFVVAGDDYTAISTNVNRLEAATTYVLAQLNASQAWFVVTRASA